MHIAARWFGWCGVAVGVAGAFAALGANRLPWSQPEVEFSTTMTYRGFVLGLDKQTLSGGNVLEQSADNEAFAGCLDAWPGTYVIRAVPEQPGIRVVLVEEHSLLEQCLELRHWSGSRFSQAEWRSPPPGATLNVPLHLGEARPRVFDELRSEREREAAEVADGSIVAMSCPTRGASRFEGLPSLELRRALWRCSTHEATSARAASSRLLLDRAGNVVRVLVPPQHLPDVPCIMATACGVRFAGLGAAYYF